MNLRYMLYRIGARPHLTELDEAVQLAELYAEEVAARFCPFLGGEG
jgi:hypothetical protein